MKHYIDKDSLVAEIERLKERFIAFHHRDGNDWPLNNYGKMRAYNEVLSFINTLEVKEVDLKKELESWRHNHFHGRRDIFANGEYLERVSQLDIAKHFFELGMAASNKAQKEEKV